MTRGRLANVVLPSLVQFETTVDLRIQFDNEKPKDFVSIAVVHIETDAENTEIWCQLSRFQIETILDKLKNTLKEMEIAEGLFKQAMPFGEK